jgi:D-ribose pyranose/furanose isomerase RbsD
LKAESDAYLPLPVQRKVVPDMAFENFKVIKKEIAELIENEIERILNSPGLENQLL